MAGPQRVELVGGTYNEPNTNLTCIETTIRNAVYGIGFQRHVIGAAPATVWQLDVFGHDPQFPQVAATRNVMIPMGSDFTPPMRWVTELRAAWHRRYQKVRLRCGLPRDFFAAVRADLAARGVRPTPQTRDMNPVYTGKDVTAIDTKQAHRMVETLLLDAEKWDTFATLHAAAYPAAALDKAWRLLLFGAHHDAVTGTQSDQVYLDLLAGWREAHDLAATVDHAAREHLARHVDTSGEGAPVVVFNPMAYPRTDTVSLHVDLPRTGGVT